jgi:DNA repair exonuclease SbcCD ATPase subunit
VRPLTLEVRAFRGFRAPFTLPLANQGIVLVEGENHDAPDAFTSNGSGKSMATVEAPMWALFDRTVRHGERAVTSEVTHPERGAEVSFTFSQGGVTYSATRSRAPKGSPKFILTQGGTPYPLSKDPATARREMAEVLGFDYIAFRHAVVVQGGDSLASAGFAAQMGVLEMILRTYTLAKAAERASQAATVADRAVASAEGAHRAATDALARARSAVAQAQQAVQVQPDPRALTEALKVEDAAAAQADVVRAEITTMEARMLTGRVERDEARYAATDARIAGEQAVQAAQKAVVAARGAVTNLACPTCKRPYTVDFDPVELQRTLHTAEIDYAQAQAHARQTLEAADSAAQRTAQEWHTLEAQALALQQRYGEADRARQRAEVLRAQLVGMEQTRRVAEEAWDRARHAEDEAARAVGVAETDLAVARGVAAQARFWALGFSRTGLQADLVAAATPVLNEAAETHAQTLTAGQILVTFDPFRATNREDLVRIAGASAPTYAGLSRGEKERVDLIIALSLRDLARWRLPEPVQFAVYDEVFDHMDEAGLRAVAGLLQADAARGATVIVVTHNPAFKALFPGAKLLRVTKRGGEADVRYIG